MTLKRDSLTALQLHNMYYQVTVIKHLQIYPVNIHKTMLLTPLLLVKETFRLKEAIDRNQINIGGFYKIYFQPYRRPDR